MSLLPEQKKAFDAVQKINNELYQKYSKKDPDNCNYDSLDKMPMLSITFANNYTFITLAIPSTNTLHIPELHIYNSEADDRIYYEKSDRYETYYKYIKRKFIEIKNEIYSIKL